MQPKARELSKPLIRIISLIAVYFMLPGLLVSSGLVKGRKLTSYYTIQMICVTLVLSGSMRIGT